MTEWDLVMADSAISFLKGHLKTCQIGMNVVKKGSSRAVPEVDQG
jgi:hypothetical protein